MCSIFELHDLSQAEKKITVVKAEQIHKMTIIFTQNSRKLPAAQSLNKWSRVKSI